MARILATLLFVFASFAPATAAPFAVSPPVDLGPASRWPNEISMATNGDSVLVAWNDHRVQRAVRGAMLDRDGIPTADRDFLISSFVSEEVTFKGPSVTVASDGNDYLVAHTRNEAMAPHWKTRFTRVTAAGDVEAGPDALDGAVRSMAYAGGYYFLVMLPDAQGWAQVELAVVDRWGRVVRSNVPLVHPDDDRARDAKIVATSDGQLLLVWESVRESGLGTALVDPDDLLVASYAGARRKARIERMRLSLAGVAAGNDGFLIACIDRGGDKELMLALLGRDGALRLRKDIRNDPEHKSIKRLLVTSHGGGYAILAYGIHSGDHYWVGALPLTGEGESPWDHFVDFNYEHVGSMAVSRKSDGSLLWARITSDRAEIAPLLVTRWGWLRAGPEVLLSRSHPSQEYSAVAQCNGTNIVVWQDTWDQSAVARLRRFSASGVPLDPPNRSIAAVAFPTWWELDLAISCGRTNVLVTWREPLGPRVNLVVGFVRGAILRPDGTLFDLGVMAVAERVRVVHDGSTFVLLTQDHNRFDEWQRWSEQGSRLDIAVAPALERRYLQELELAWNGSTLMVAWRGRIATYRDTEIEVRAHEFQRNFIPIGSDIIVPPANARAPWNVVLGGRPGGWLASWYDSSAAHSSTLNGDAVVSRNNFMPRQLSWNGSEWELLGDRGVALLDETGRMTSFRHLTRDEKVQAMTTSGEHRLFTFLRTDPETGLNQLYADVIHESQLETNRGRSARP